MTNSKVKVCNHQRNDENIWNTCETDWYLMEYYLCWKHTLFVMTKMPGLIILEVTPFFCMAHPVFRGVLIAHLGSDSFVVKNKRNDDVSRILKLEVTTSDIDCVLVNPLSANPPKWSNTLKQFVVKLPTNCLSVFGHFVKLGLQGIKCKH